MSESVSSTNSTCTQCGARLSIPPSVRFLTCSHCGTRLRVRREDGVVFTELLERVAAETERLAGELSVAELQQRIHELDHEWTLQEAELMVPGDNGELVPPGPEKFVQSAMMGVFGVMWTYFVSRAKPEWPLVIWLLFMGMGLAMVIADAIGAHQTGKAIARYYRARARYRARREELLQRLADAE